MIDPPVIAERAALHAAVIALVIPRGDMPKHFGAAVAEIHAELARQGIAAAGPVFAHHLRMPPGMFDLEVGVRRGARSATGSPRTGTCPRATCSRRI